MQSPSDRGCLEWACRIVYGIDPETGVFVRRDLIGSGVGEQFANRVYDHLVDVLISEWAALRGRIRWYADNTTCTVSGETADQGGS